MQRYFVTAVWDLTKRETQTTSNSTATNGGPSEATNAGPSVQMGARPKLQMGSVRLQMGDRPNTLQMSACPKTATNEQPSEETRSNGRELEMGPAKNRQKTAKEDNQKLDAVKQTEEQTVRLKRNSEQPSIGTDAEQPSIGTAI